MKPTWSRRSCVSALSSSDDRSVWPRKMLPLVTASRPARQCIKVDFPEPDGPMMAVNRPLGNPTVMESSARTAASPSP